MGIYTSNRYFGEAYDYAAEIPANEAYDAAFGCAHILADNQANDMALFESSIYSDIQEVMSLHEGVQVVNENAFSNVIKKIVEMFKKLLAKIKGIFNAFLAKLAGAFKNGKDLVKKYEKQIIKYSNWKDLKIKGIRKPKEKDIKGALEKMFTFEIKTAYKLPDTVASGTDAENVKFTGITGFESAKKIKDGDSEDIKTALISEKYVNFKVSDYKDIDSEIKDKLYDDEDTLDGEDDIKSASFFSETWIKSVLSDDKWEKDVQKAADKMDKVINKIIDDLNKVDDNLAKHMTNKDTAGVDADLRDRKFGQSGEIKKDTSVRTANTDVKGVSKNGTYNNAENNKKINEYFQVWIHALQTIASNEQEVITKVTSLYMENIKFATAQARKIWTAAAAWSSTTHKESVEYYQALGEAAAEQFYMNMETIGA